MFLINDESNDQVIIRNQEVLSDLTGFTLFGELSTLLNTVNKESVILDFSQVKWFDAHLCSVLGALILRHTSQNIRLVNLTEKVNTIFRRNGFHNYFGSEGLCDGWNSTMRFNTFNNSTLSEHIINYLDTEIEGKRIPIMSQDLRSYFLNSITEIFQNSCIHSATSDHYCICGQFFPNKGKLTITFTDTGVGFAKNYNDCFGTEIEAHKAIEWAVGKGHTTNQGRPGGLGLSFIIEFLELNSGTLRIVSDAGHWYFQAGKRPLCNLLKYSFHGTIIVIEINTNDNKRYKLVEEDQEIPF